MNISLINILVFSVPPRIMGVATGANSLFRNFGSTRGPAIAGTIMSTYYTLLKLPGVPIPLKIPTEKAYEMLFGGAAGIYLLLALLILATREVTKGGRIHEMENEGEKEVVVE
ncbi:hypothetical protein [Thermococcus sp. 2319x1]|uniref:hypothetical protein n=1 Tax=Thermococcus sp. 2319x1 TaxID=1674923 RepID=UPI001E44592C|nr:hypothetical protein [Thermococcus sp. 2319x1]